MTTIANVACGLLTVISLYAETSPQFQDPTTTTAQMLFYIGLLALALAMLASISWAVRRWQNRREQKIEVQRWRLFRELCAIHGLKRGETTQLRRLAKILKLANPAMLFVKPDCFEVPRPTRYFSLESWGELLKLRDKLFARRLGKAKSAS